MSTGFSTSIELSLSELDIIYTSSSPLLIKLGF